MTNPYDRPAKWVSIFFPFVAIEKKEKKTTFEIRINFENGKNVHSSLCE